MASAPNVVDLTTLDNESDDEETTHSFFIPLQPVPMPRVRRGRSGAFYNPASKCIRQLRDFLLGLLHERQLPTPLFASGTPVALSLHFHRQRPLSHFIGRSRTKALRADAPDYIHVSTPDLDNLEKLFMDAATGILYEDDRQVFFKCSCRLWTDPKHPDGYTLAKVKTVSHGARLTSMLP